jgi:hypothetical protein
MGANDVVVVILEWRLAGIEHGKIDDRGAFEFILLDHGLVANIAIDDSQQLPTNLLDVFGRRSRAPRLACIEKLEAGARSDIAGSPGEPLLMTCNAYVALLALSKKVKSCQMPKAKAFADQALCLQMRNSPRRSGRSALL